MAEKEYIEREAIYDKLHNIGGCDATDDWSKGWDKAIDAAINIIEAIPAADVVEVVRCKDCKYLLKDPSEREAHLCSRNGFIRGRVNLDDFCSYGERKELDNGKT
ncbi:MAG: hypothetical protein ACI4J6_07180 [Oscillospiraceae bacterium]